MAEELNDRPDYRCPEHAAQEPARKIVRDVERGTLHLREMGKEYLPQFPAEHKDDYEIRRKAATLFNAYNRTVSGLIGMVFKKNPVLEEDVPVEIRGDKEKGEAGHAENIDLAGTHLDLFCRDVLRDAMNDGHCYVLVDMQKAPTEGRRGRVTQEDVDRARLRPYWVRYTKDQAVNWRATLINGEVEIGQITFEEETCELAGRYGLKAGKQYRTFRLEEYRTPRGLVKHRVKFELNKLVQDKDGDRFERMDGGEVKGFSRIPVAVVYGRKTGFLTSQPVLLDLALINLKHYQKRSEYDATLRKCGFPIPVFIGRDRNNPALTIGPGSGVDVPMNGDAKYMEPEGNSLEAARHDLQDLREEMAALGLSVLSSRPGVAATATETVIDFTQESSELETIARSESDAIELCLGFHARHLGKKEGGSVSLGTHLKSLTLTPQQVSAYSQMVGEGQLTLYTLWSILKSGNALPDDFDSKVESKRLFGTEEEPTAAERAAAEDSTRKSGEKPLDDPEVTDGD